MKGNPEGGSSQPRIAYWHGKPKRRSAIFRSKRDGLGGDDGENTFGWFGVCFFFGGGWQSID